MADDEDQDRYYDDPRNRDRKLVSVTTVNNATIPKPGLMRHHADMAAAYVLANPDGIVNHDALRAAAVAAAPRHRDQAAANGTLAHSCFDAEAIEHPDPDDIPKAGSDVQGMVKISPEDRAAGRPHANGYIELTDEERARVAPVMDRFREFRRIWRPAFIACEATVYSLTDNPDMDYAGKIDVLWTFTTRPLHVFRTLDRVTELVAIWTPGELLLGDYKTGRSIDWPEQDEQVGGGYFHCNTIHLRDNTDELHPMPALAGAVIVHAPFDGRPWAMRPIVPTPEHKRAFLASRARFNDRKTAQRAMCRPVTVDAYAADGTLTISGLGGINAPVALLLACEGVATIGDLAKYGRAAFNELDGVGPATLAAADRYLAAHQLTWADQPTIPATDPQEAAA